MLCTSKVVTTPTTGSDTTTTTTSAITAPRAHHDHARHLPRITPPLFEMPRYY